MLKLSFGSGVTLAYFEHHPTRLFTASDHLDCRYVRAYFKQQGATATQYAEPNLSNIYDAAEDLIALGNERIAFYVTAANSRLCDRLTVVLKELDDRCQIVWFGEYACVHGEALMNRTQVDGLVMREPEATLYALSNAEPEEWNAIPGFLGRDGSENSYTSEPDSSLLYELDQFNGIWEEAAQTRQTPIFNIKCADRLGRKDHKNGLRTHSPDRFKRDLELAVHAASRAAGARLHIEGFQHLHPTTARNEILEILAQAKEKISFKVEVPLEWMTEDDFRERLGRSGITEIIMIAPMLMTERQVREGNSFIDHLKHLKASDKRLTIAVKLTDSFIEAPEADSRHTAEWLTAWTSEAVIDGNHVKAETNQPGREQDRLFLPEPIQSYLLKNATHEPQSALTNGYVAYMTGSYPGPSTGGSVKHIGYTEGTWNPSSVHRLGEYSGINSALLFEHNQVNREEKCVNIYADQDGVWKRENGIFDGLLHTAEQEQYYLSNAHQMIRRDDHEFELQMNDFLQIKPLQIRNMDYSTATRLQPDGDEVEFQFLEITSEEDLDVFLQDVDHFSRTGKFRHGFEIQSYMVDSCRWSGAHHCRARELPRIFVDGQDQISACRGCSAIGDMYDTFDSLLTQVSIISDQEQLLRGCRTCEIKDSCSKCSFLPGYMNRQQYCDLRKKHVMLHRYMQMVQLFKGLRKYTQALQGIGIPEIRVSLPTCTHQWPRQGGENINSLVHDTVFLFFVRNEPMLFHAVSQKIMKLNELTALILEAFMAGADEQELVEHIAEKYQVEKEYAAKSVSQAMEMFTREGCLKKMPAKAV